MRANRIGLALTLALHVFAAAALLSYEPARRALLAAAPIMVDLIVPPKLEPPKIEPPKPKPPAEPPKPRQVAKPIVQPVTPSPILTAPAEAPSPVTAAPPAPAPVAVVGSGTSESLLPTTQPIFNADYLDNPKPFYPPTSRRIGEQGTVLLSVLVSAQGAAEEVSVRKSSGFPRLDEAARNTVLRWKFVPARRGNEAVPWRVTVPVNFELNKG